MRIAIFYQDALDAFGRFIRRRRERLGWSQRVLEAVTGIDQTVISRIENGRFRNLRLHQIAPLLCTLAPEILEVKVRQDGTIEELRTWEAVRPFAPPFLQPPHE
jgi:transcriptional regulator with XRE-family HTH domain